MKNPGGRSVRFGSQTVRLNMRVIGLLLIVAGLLTAIPVAVNFPDSWPGAALVVALVGAGAVSLLKHGGDQEPGRRS